MINQDRPIVDTRSMVVSNAAPAYTGLKPGESLTSAPPLQTAPQQTAAVAQPTPPPQQNTGGTGETPDKTMSGESSSGIRVSSGRFHRRS